MQEIEGVPEQPEIPVLERPVTKSGNPVRANHNRSRIGHALLEMMERGEDLVKVKDDVEIGQCSFCDAEDRPLVAKLVADTDQKVCQTCHRDSRIPTVPIGTKNPSYWLGEAPAKCNIGGEPIVDKFVDGNTKFGPWGFMCVNCHARHGYGLGTGKGQLYQKQEDGRWLKVGG